MAEPASSSAAGYAGWHAVGGAAGVAAGGAGLASGLAAIVVMCMLTPRNRREWAVGIISTVVASVSGGAALVQYFGLQGWIDTYIGAAGLIGLCFACGLPGWALVRAVFTWIEKRKALDIGELINDARRDIGRGVQP